VQKSISLLRGITYLITDVVIISPCNCFNSVMVLHLSNKERMEV
jgi:hypothetical protein